MVSRGGKKKKKPLTLLNNIKTRLNRIRVGRGFGFLRYTVEIQTNKGIFHTNKKRLIFSTHVLSGMLLGLLLYFSVLFSEI